MSIALAIIEMAKADAPKSDNATAAAPAAKAVGDIITLGHYERDNDAP